MRPSLFFIEKKLTPCVIKNSGGIPPFHHSIIAFTKTFFTMKKSPVTLAIPTPCHENWQAMTPAEQGRFCQSCQKTVMDFTTKTDREVARYFEKGSIGESTGSTCGRFRHDQLHRPLHVERPDGFGTRLRTLGLVVPGLLLGGFAQAQTDRPVLMGKVACPRPNTTQVEPRIVGEVAVVPPKALMGDTMVVETPKARIITGAVTDKETNESLIGANIILLGTNIGTVTDIDGKYELTIPDSIENPVLQYSYTGYAGLSIEVGRQSMVNAKMEVGYALVGDVIVVQQEQTVYNLVKHKINNLIYNMRERQTAMQIEKSKMVAASNALPLPAAPSSKAPNPALPEAIPTEVFPNPFSHDLAIKFDSPEAERLHIRLMDMQGHIVFTQTYEAMKGPQVLTLETTGVHLPSGQYLLEVSNGEVLRYAGLVMKE